MTKNVPYLIDVAGRKFELRNPTTRLGRSPDCDVFIADRRVSRQHAEIHWEEDCCILHDLGSANGTYLNGRHINYPQRLYSDDEIAIGSAILTFRDPEATLHNSDFPLLVVGENSVDIWVNRIPVSLSSKEQALFDALYAAQGEVRSKQEIAETVWPEYQAQVYDYQVESLVKRLREKLEPDPRNPVLLLTVHGRGYKLVNGPA
ncbi:MAG: FHA domain-containing protein [Anaerolineae bacterium]